MADGMPELAVHAGLFVPAPAGRAEQQGRVLNFVVAASPPISDAKLSLEDDHSETGIVQKERAGV